MKIERFAPHHLERLNDYGGQEYLVPLISADELAGMTSKGDHYAFLSEGRVVGCAGVMPMTEYRGIAWALLQTNQPKRFAAFHLLARRLLYDQPYRRIEAYVDPAFAPATRWVRLLGFELETAYKPLWFPDGRGAAEWVLYNRTAGE